MEVCSKKFILSDVDWYESGIKKVTVFLKTENDQHGLYKYAWSS